MPQTAEKIGSPTLSATSPDCPHEAFHLLTKGLGAKWTSTLRTHNVPPDLLVPLEQSALDTLSTICGWDFSPKESDLANVKHFESCLRSSPPLLF